MLRLIFDTTNIFNHKSHHFNVRPARYITSSKRCCVGRDSQQEFKSLVASLLHVHEVTIQGRREASTRHILPTTRPNAIDLHEITSKVSDLFLRLKRAPTAQQQGDRRGRDLLSTSTTDYHLPITFLLQLQIFLPITTPTPTAKTQPPSIHMTISVQHHAHTHRPTNPRTLLEVLNLPCRSEPMPLHPALSHRRLERHT